MAIGENETIPVEIQRVARGVFHHIFPKSNTDSCHALVESATVL